MSSVVMLTTVSRMHGQTTGPALTASSPQTNGAPCHAHGTITSGGTPLPGAAIAIKDGARTVAVTSTDVDGTYALAASPGTYTLRVELTPFDAIERSIALSGSPCAGTVDVQMALTPRTVKPSTAGVEPATPVTQGFGAMPPRRDGPPQPAMTAPPTAGTGRPPSGTRPAGAAAGFQSLFVQQAEGGSVVDAAAGGAQADDPASRLLPPGFALSNGAVGSVQVSGSLMQIDVGQLADRAGALARGDFSLADGQGPFGGGRGPGGPGGPFGGGPGGGMGPGFDGFLPMMGGANRTSYSATYQLGGSFLNAAPYPLNGREQDKPLNAQNGYSFTMGGPLKIHGLYDGGSRTTYNFSYNGNANGTGYNTFATVPTDAWRRGDFSANAVALIDPATNQPFPDNQIPVSAAAAALVRYIPEPTQPDSTSQNYERSGTSHAYSNGFNLRLTHRLTTSAAGGPRGFGGPGRFGGPGGFPGPPGLSPGSRPGAQTAGKPAWNVTLNGSVNYRRSDNDRIGAFPTLDGTQQGSMLATTTMLTAARGASVQMLSFTMNRTTASTSNLEGGTSVGTSLGIAGVSDDPFDAALPTLSFTNGLTSLTGLTPSQRTTGTYQLSYSSMRFNRKHTWRFGGDYQRNTAAERADANPNGTFVFSGLYTAAGADTARGSGQDFADFLLGMPASASAQYLNCAACAADERIRTRSTNFSLFVTDDWRWKARFTVNFGLRYEFIGPYSESSGQMATLDADPAFTAVAVVMPDQTGPYSGRYPSTLVRPDWNNLSPRVGAAWRANNRSTVRFGYGLTYNSGTYSTIAKRLYSQAPSFVNLQATGSVASPLTLATALVSTPAGTITETYGIDQDYRLGMIHQFNADYAIDVFKVYQIGATWVGTLGRDLDILLAPNQGPNGLRLADVQAFEFQESAGRSHASSLSIRLQRRQSHGVAGAASYTWQRSRDNTTATSGGTTAAQNFEDLDAEWGLSAFNRTHAVNGSMTVQLPWGTNRHWLSSGGVLASIVGDWTVAANLLLQTGTPLTASCACATNITASVRSTLRADYIDGRSIQLASPIVGADSVQFFNPLAFAVPEAGRYGTATRNQITGPGVRQLTASVTRDVRLSRSRSRSMSIQVTVTNPLNFVNYTGVDTNVNSRTFAQVLSVGQMRSARVNLRFRL